MKLALDVGNTRIKAGIFDEADNMIHHAIVSYKDFPEYLNNNTYKIEHCLVSDVKGMDNSFFSLLPGELFILNSESNISITLDYKTPKTLGIDRIANMLGACQIFPNKNCIVIDAGSCITLDIITKAKVYIGGRISPGIKMRFKSMHEFTGKLPLVKNGDMFTEIGKSTEESMKSGVYGGIRGEIIDFIRQYKQHFGEIRVILTGGDTKYLKDMINYKIFAAPNIVLHGLINAYNHQKKS